MASSVPELVSGDDDNTQPADDGSKDPIRRQTRGHGVLWWFLVAIDMAMLLSGGTVATLLSRLYYNSGGNSKWMTTLTQSGGSPLLVVPLLLTPPPPRGEEQPRQPPPAASKLAAVYIGIGVLIGVDNLMYAYALLYLPVSTFSLVAATQLAFNAVTSRLINAQRFTPLITNSVAVLTFSATLLAVSSSSDTSGGDHLPRGKYAAGFVLTLAASATFALILSLYEVTFEKVIKAQTPRGGGGGDDDVRGVEDDRRRGGGVSGWEGEVSTLAGTAVAWQAANLGQVRLAARVSSLFANATGTVQLPLVPVFAVVLFGDR
ncbi:hypothetical protein HU200_056125 [Digitaria exilis]|uniref:Probable purine permease n=1 Tax=Digitaria exilis TaxID=1010633 RepID=A0A835AM02_9POAL|nr:hypothetical protein HU200_056125 [Digitaria exilis]